MRVGDDHLDEIRSQGYTLVADFLDDEELTAAQHCLWHEFPRPDEYFADPTAHARYSRSQFAGLRLFPTSSWALNRLAFHPDLVDLAERYLGSDDLELYKCEIWAKYAGAIDYDQPHHRDFGNHSLVVPRTDGVGAQLTSFILLSDVTELDGPTAVVPLGHTTHVPMVADDAEPGWPFSVRRGTFADVEVPVTGPAGSLFVYRTDVFHRGTDFGAPGRSRFALLADFQVRGPAWAGKMCWPNHAQHPGFVEVIERASVRERDLFGFPRPGDAYWNEQTLRDVQLRYPQLDLTPYASAS
jgi:hypothetical protein